MPSWTPGAEDLWGDPTPVPPVAAAPPSRSGRRRAVEEPTVTDPGAPAVAESGEPAAPVPQVEKKRSRSGRNMPAAIGVGVAMGAAVVASLFIWRPAFLGLIVVAISVAVWEMTRAVGSGGAHPPLPPLLAGGALMAGLAWFGHADGLVFGLIVTILAVMVWRLADGLAGYGLDVSAGGLIAVYVPFLGGFAAMLAVAPDGDLRVIAMVAGVVLSDTGGFIAGVFLGKHPMAPSVSPKKSWEGFAGSLICAAAGSAVMLHFALDVVWWQGAIFGLAVSAASVLGDLAESLLKRDLNIKDMSNLLPGHGGLMDRLDSILLAAPTAYAVLAFVAPAG